MEFTALRDIVHVGSDYSMYMLITPFVLAITYYASLALYNIYLHPLSRFPGPPFKRAFALPGILEIWQGTSVQKTRELHDKHGSVVRVAPDALSFSSAQAWRDIYGFCQGKRQIPKDFKRAPPVENALPILFSNDTDHARMRKLISHAFSDSALRAQKPLIATHMSRFISQIHAQSTQNEGGKVDMNAWFNYLAFDVVTDLSFGETLGTLEKGTCDEYIDGFFAGCKFFGAIPMVHEYTVCRWMFAMLMKVPAVKRGEQDRWSAATRKKVEKRMSAKTDRNDFMSHILLHNDEKGMTQEEIVGSTTVLVNAGGEATAACMGATIYYLLQTPRAYKRAVEETRATYSSEAEIITSSNLGQLPYMNAVLKEIFRIYAPTPGNFARRTDEPTLIDGHMIPPGISVGVHQYAAGRSSANFFEPDMFMPERWLDDAPRECANDDKSAVQPWTLGPRACLGRNLAMLEITTALTLVLWRFDLELCEEGRGWAERQTYNIVWNRGPLWVRLQSRNI